MLFARAMSNGVRWYCPDVAMAPLYTPDELGAQVDGESGEVIEAEPVAATASADEENETGEALAARDASREQLLEHVTALCVELGYDEQLQHEARARAEKLSDADIGKKAIESLDRLTQAKRTELSQKITAELVGMGLDEEQMAGYVGANGGQAKRLEDCTLSEMRKVAEGLEIT